MKKFIIYTSLSLLIISSCKGKDKAAMPTQPAQDTVTGLAQTEAISKSEEVVQQQKTPSISPSTESPILISRIGVTPDTPKIGDTIKINVVPKTDDISSIPITFEWRRNGSRLPETSNALLITNNFKRGDKIGATVTVDNGKGRKNSWLASLVIANSPPEILSSTEFIKVNGNRFSFYVKAKDADGDQLNYALKSAPEGTTIDSATGKVIFPVPADTKSPIQITVLVTDGHGGESLYNFEMAIKAEGK